MWKTSVFFCSGGWGGGLKWGLLSMCLDPAVCFKIWRFVFCFVLFLFFFAVVSAFTRQSALLSTVHGTQPFYLEKNIKNGSYGTIHTFKNYFVTMFLVFSF